MPEIGPHNVARCDLSAVEINELGESPFRRDEKLPSATERHLAIQDHKRTKSFLILSIKHRSVAVRNCQARRNGILQYKIMKTIVFYSGFHRLTGSKLCNTPDASAMQDCKNKRFLLIQRLNCATFMRFGNARFKHKTLVKFDMKLGNAYTFLQCRIAKTKGCC